MSIIKVMSVELANRIAAGEVVERPGSVVKELVENSIDSGADRISVSIEKAGTRLIQVTDNGCGMDEQDALLAFEPHGTSKLLCDDDLMKIGTLGFRGEAIPSIASVSRFTLRTRVRTSGIGTKVCVDAGVMVSKEPDGSPPGTTIEVRDLFYNVPARKKFLKSPATEEHHIEECMINLALGHFEQSFELKIDRRISFSSAGAKTPDLRIRELFGRSFSNNLLPVDHKENGIVITGFIASPGFTRPGRRDQRIFINRRAVESVAVRNGIRDGFGTLESEAGRYPPAILYLQIDPAELDVNIHPAKREVRFKSEYTITRCVANAVSSALRRDAAEGYAGNSNGSQEQVMQNFSAESIIDAAMVKYKLKGSEEQSILDFGSDKAAPDKELRNTAPVFIRDDQFTTILSDDDGSSIETTKSGTELEKTADDIPEPVIFSGKPAEAAPFTPRAALPEEPSFRGNWPTEVLGIFRNTYIMCDSPGGLVFVDQHAAHEKILFEK